MKYPAIVSQSGGSFLVEFPGLTGCVTEGVSLNEALTNAKEALNGWLESNYDRNLTVKMPEECLRLVGKSLKKNMLTKIPVNSILALAYQMRFSRKNDGNKSLQELADLMNVSQQNYSKVFENPKANPTLATIEKGLSELGYFLELNIRPKSETIASKKNKHSAKLKINIQNFDLPELKKKRA
ncbi:MAG: type II toxin-antitoxin system HicB family antitoxin [Bdellovibrionota bacterium]|jgi:antitoxin HicB